MRCQPYKVFNTEQLFRSLFRVQYGCARRGVELAKLSIDERIRVVPSKDKFRVEYVELCKAEAFPSKVWLCKMSGGLS